MKSLRSQPIKKVRFSNSPTKKDSSIPQKLPTPRSKRKGRQGDSKSDGNQKKQKRK